MLNEVRKTILLVEDEPIIAMSEEHVLNNYGFNVVKAGSGEKSVEAVKKFPSINLVLMDINLGRGITGTESSQLILEDHDIPIIFLSSHTEREVVEKTEGITSYGYIVKNSGDTVLIASIKMAFKLYEARLMEKQNASALRKSESRLKKLNQTYAMLSEINKAIIHNNELQILFDIACRVSVDKGGFTMVWIGIFDPDTKEIKPIANAGKIEDYLVKLKIIIDDCKQGKGPTVTAVREGRHWVTNDIEHDPAMEQWREDAMHIGFYSSACFPLFVSGKVKGALNFYSKEPDYFDVEELKLLDRIASDISFAMELSDQERINRKP